MIDESREQDSGQAAGQAVYRVEWFHTERPVAGTTFRRPPLPPPALGDGVEDTTSR